MSHKDSSSKDLQGSSRRRVRVRNPFFSGQYEANGRIQQAQHSAVTRQPPSDSIICMSSASRVWEVVSKFDDTKKKLVACIGLGGILELPQFTHSNNKFSLWLLSRIRWYSGKLTVSEDLRFTITPEHVWKIIGISCRGLDVVDKSFKNDDDKMLFERTKLSFLGSGNKILEAAEAFLQDDDQYPSTKDLADKFKIAFVIFVMGRFLAPASKPDIIKSDFWGALANPDQIGAFNWSSYVLLNILEAARTVNWDALEDISVSHISGCTLIIQILYLDMIDFGHLNLEHNVFPRTKHFRSDLITTMIESVLHEDTKHPSGFSFGRIQGIRLVNNCYLSGKEVLTTTTNSTPQRRLSSFPNSTGIIDITTSSPTSSSSNPVEISAKMPTNLPSSPSVFDTEVMDFSAFIRNNYHGQLDGPLEDALKAHNARCLNHIHKFTRGLSAAITKENAKLAVKYIEHFNQNKCENPSKSAPNKHRQKSYDDIVSEPESGNEGNSSNSKVPRSGTQGACTGNISINKHKYHEKLSPTTDSRRPPTPIDCSQQHSVAKPHGGLLVCSEKLQSDVAKGQTPVASANFGSITPTYSVVKYNCSNPSKRAPNKHWQKPSEFILSEPESGNEGNSLNSKVSSTGNACNNKRKTLEKVSYTTDVRRPPTPSASSQQNLVPKPHGDLQLSATSHVPVAKKQTVVDMFETPVASTKLGSITPTYSPTTENKLYAGVDLSLKMLSTIQSIDLNARSFEAEYNSSPITRKDAHGGTFAVSHWALGLDYPAIDIAIAHTFYQWLSSTNSGELHRCWIMHEVPRFFEIEGYTLQEEFTEDHFMSDDVFDTAIRRYKQLDQHLYQTTVGLRWRHFLESDYAMHVLADENPLDNIPVREQFAGLGLDYELCRCSMFFVPIRVGDIWWCYAWDLPNKKLFIIDPLISIEIDEGIIRRHYGTIQMLKKSLSQTVTEVYNGWNPCFNDCKTVVLRTSGMPCARSQTGFFTLFCIKNFNGACLTVEPSEANMVNFKEYLLHEMLELKDNRARLPAAFIHVID